MKNIITNLLNNKKGKIFLPFTALVFFGLVMEVVVRAISGSLVGFHEIKYLDLFGQTSLWMIPVYFTGSFILSVINDIERFYKISMLFQTIIGFIIITISELLWGLFLIHICGIKAWDYSKEFGNLYGVICIGTCIEWLVATPLFIFIIDKVDYYIYDEERWNYGWLNNYKDIWNDLKNICLKIRL